MEGRKEEKREGGRDRGRREAGRERGREGGREERRDEGGEKVTLTPNSKHRVIVTASPVY